MQIQDKILQFVGYFSIFLIVYGTISNLLVFSVCMRKRLRQTPLFVYLSFKVICDTVPLYTFGFNPYFLFTFGYNIGDINIYLCRLATYLTYTVEETAAWLMVILIFLFCLKTLKNTRNIKGSSCSDMSTFAIKIQVLELYSIVIGFGNLFEFFFEKIFLFI